MRASPIPMRVRKYSVYPWRASYIHVAVLYHSPNMPGCIKSSQAGFESSRISSTPHLRVPQPFPTATGESDSNGEERRERGRATNRVSRSLRLPIACRREICASTYVDTYRRLFDKFTISVQGLSRRARVLYQLLTLLTSWTLRTTLTTHSQRSGTEI